MNKIERRIPPPGYRHAARTFRWGLGAHMSYAFCPVNPVKKRQILCYN
ncbi:MAG: hypothetical protein F6J98_37765 [Moorea sp. SIO4G2]|nr:hypothetical protein [Moorena sp. SIO4G2]